MCVSKDRLDRKVANLDSVPTRGVEGAGRQGAAQSSLVLSSASQIEANADVLSTCCTTYLCSLSRQPNELTMSMQVRW